MCNEGKGIWNTCDIWINSNFYGLCIGSFTGIVYYAIKIRFIKKHYPYEYDACFYFGRRADALIGLWLGVTILNFIGCFWNLSLLIGLILSWIS